MRKQSSKPAAPAPSGRGGGVRAAGGRSEAAPAAGAAGRGPEASPAGVLDDVGELTAFVRVVEARGYSAAARRLGATTSALSKRVARLESALGVRLLERTTRRLAPTEAGAAFYERCVHILEALAEAERAVTRLGGGARGTLRLSAPVIFGELHVAPLVPPLLER
ncbi:MAG TPA: LysR family transcriptional regulator, partial [Polyangiaceae bacterium]|nr:LysR family transcriptional regulator [Polyangiaceae bacterium]